MGTTAPEQETCMMLPGSRWITTDEARARIAAAIGADADRSLLDDDLMLADRREEVLMVPNGLTITDDLKLDWTSADLDGKWFHGIFIDGDLEIAGDIVNDNWDGGPFLVVGGTTRVRHIFKRGAPAIFAGPLQASGGIVCEYNHGCFHALGGVTATALVIDDQRYELKGPIQARTLISDRDDGRAVLAPDLLHEEDDGEVVMIDDINDALIARIKAGKPIFRED